MGREVTEAAGNTVGFTWAQGMELFEGTGASCQVPQAQLGYISEEIPPSL